MSEHRRLRDRLARLRGSPEAIARGAAIGMVVTFTPTIGLQTILVLGIATLLRASRPAAIVPTFFTSPVTIPPIFGFTYYLGSWFWPGPAPSRVSAALVGVGEELSTQGLLAVRERLDVLLDLGLDVLIAMWIGGLIVGVATAAITYPLTRRAVIRRRGRRKWKAEKADFDINPK
ncbi:MAG: DUF2062 domain-containing protein [bacterium]|nr:DUF2062 domain-containing protein [bacterium]